MLAELDTDELKPGFPDPTEQDEVFDHFKKLLGEEDAGKLHQFFSPTRIPKELSLEHAKVCVALQPIRAFYSKSLACETLPKELCYRGKPISEKDFLTGISRFLDQVNQQIDE